MSAFLPVQLHGFAAALKCPVVDLVHDFPLGAVQPPPLHGDLHPLPHLRVALVHLHVPPWEHLIELLLPVLTSAVLDYGVDQLINPGCFGELRDLVAQPLGFVFGHVGWWCIGCVGRCP